MKSSFTRIKRIWFVFCLLFAVLPAGSAAAEEDNPLIAIYAVYPTEAVEVGEPIDKEKLIVTALYLDGYSKQLEEYEYSLSTEHILQVDRNEITVVYMGKSAKFYAYGKGISKLTVGYTGNLISVGNSVGRENVTLIVSFTDGTSKRTDDFTLSNDVIAQTGPQNVLVTYRGIATQFTVYGIPSKVARSLVATYQGGKVVQGQVLDKKDILVTAVYVDNTTERIYNFSLNPGIITDLGTNIVEVSYQNVKAEIQVECVTKTLEKITVWYNDTKVEVGRPVQKEDLLVRAYYDDGSVVEVKDYTLFPSNVMNVGNNTVTVDYHDMKADFKVVGVMELPTDFTNSMTFTATNGTDRATVSVSMGRYLKPESITGKSRKPGTVKKVLGKIGAQQSEFIAFDLLLEDETVDDIFPLSVRITIPKNYKLEYTNVYYTSNRKTVIGRMEIQKESDKFIEMTIYHEGTYIISYQEPEEEEEEDEAMKPENEYLD